MRTSSVVGRSVRVAARLEALHLLVLEFLEQGERQGFSAGLGALGLRQGEHEGLATGGGGGGRQLRCFTCIQGEALRAHGETR